MTEDDKALLWNLSELLSMKDPKAYTPVERTLDSYLNIWFKNELDSFYEKLGG